MKQLFAFVLLACASVADTSAVEQDKVSSAELKKLEGTWHLISFKIDGKKETLIDGRLIIQGNKMTTYVGDNAVSEATFSIDPTKKPKTIDFVAIKPGKGTKSVGIYEHEGDYLRICGAEGEKRPTAFSAKEGSGWGLSLYMRAKK
jgi:uncharacterized protein (TIGR03067 family)